MALYNGRLSVVQSIMVTELVFSLVIGRLWVRAMRRRPLDSAFAHVRGPCRVPDYVRPKGGHAAGDS